MTLPEAAAILKVHPDSLRNAVKRGTLRADKIGRDWHVTAQDIEDYRQNHSRRK